MTGSAVQLRDTITELPDLDRRQVESDRLLEAEGAGHIVHDLPVRSDGRSVSLESRPWRIDPIPFTLEGNEFEALANAVAGRMRMLEAVLVDLYGARSLLADGILDAGALWSSPRYRLAALMSNRTSRRLTSYAVDVIQDEAGTWHAVRDYTDAPSGLGYALLDRSVTAQVHRDVLARIAPTGGPRSLDPFADHLLDGLADLATSASPRIVVMSGGVEHRSFVEQSYLATRLGLNLAEGADLVVRQRRLWLRSLAGLEPIDVLFRRLEDDRLDPMEVNAEGHVGIPGLLLAARSGGVQLANAHGSGVIEDPVLAGDWDRAGEWLAHLHERAGSSPLPMLASGVRPSWRRWPGFEGGRVVERAAVLRLYAVASDRGIEVLPGGTARVLVDGDDPVTPTAATTKDVWVVGGTAPTVACIGRRRLPQVDLIASVPTRAAEALFWAGRALERSELIARAMRVVLDRTGGGVDEDGWVAPALEMLTEICGLRDGAVSSESPVLVVDAAAGALADQIGALLAEASSVREFFSVTAGRVLARLAESRAALRAGIADEGSLVHIGLVDGVLIDLASFVGLWTESVVRGPAWRFGEIGRRLERVFGLIDGVRGASHSTDEPAEAPVDDPESRFATRRLIEVVLATNESLVAYRRRYRSDIEVATAMHLLLASDRNPRAAASSLKLLGREAEALGWDTGASEARRMIDELAAADLASLADAETVMLRLWEGCDHLARDLVGTRLASPVDPRMMGRP